jgi:glycosyltransferase involved in cell wall biosynthesis
MTTPALDVLIPTYDRPAALAVTLASLTAQTFADFRIVVSDQGETPVLERGEVRSVARVLERHGRPVEFHRHLPRRGMAEQRQFLLDQARGRAALFLDDDLVLEPDLLERLLTTLDEEGCGFVGCGLIGLSFADDVRPHEQDVELWDGPVEPETIRREGPGWERWRLHNAANPLHLAQRLGIGPGERVRYKVAWCGGCVLYDTQALRSAGGFGFWADLPPQHAQLRVMALRGGCGILPSGAYHQELPTTIPERPVDAPRVLPVEPAAGRA